MKYIQLPERKIFIHSIESYSYDCDVEDDGDSEDGEEVSRPIIKSETLNLHLVSGQHVIIEGDRARDVLAKLESVSSEL